MSAQVFMSDIHLKERMDYVWCSWLGPSREHWPQRACLGVQLEGATLVEITAVAVRGPAEVQVL